MVAELDNKKNELAEDDPELERLRREIANLRLLADGKFVTLTVSSGVSEWRPGESIDEMLRRADMALYSAKAAVRNCVVCADDGLAVKEYAGAERAVRAMPGDEDLEAAPEKARSAA